MIKGGEANFSFCDFEPIFLHEFLPKSLKEYQFWNPCEILFSKMTKMSKIGEILSEKCLKTVDNQ